MVREATCSVHYSPVGAPRNDLEAVRSATRRVLRTVDELTDTQAAGPSGLPEWTRAEVLAHLARNADGFRNMAEGAASGESRKMYPGGASERAAGIAAGRNVRATVLVHDLRTAADALMESWNRLSDDAWSYSGETPTARRTLAICPWLRMRELELHHVDLDLGYTCTDWPVMFVTRALNEGLATLGQRAAAGRPIVNATYRVEATDQGQGWAVTLDGSDVNVDSDGVPAAEVSATVSGWGCDLLAWLNGRRPAGGTLTAAGDEMRALRLPQWFPYS
jgi:maleylpyruvate isomerase